MNVHARTPAQRTAAMLAEPPHRRPQANATPEDVSDALTAARNYVRRGGAWSVDLAQYVDQWLDRKNELDR